jgi:sec-independent protein translocase protein TatA
MSIPGPLAFFSGAPGAGELIVIFLVILILFGPKRLPEITKTIGKIAAQLRRASNDFRDQIIQIDQPQVHDVPPEPDETMEKAPEEAERKSQASESPTTQEKA